MRVLHDLGNSTLDFVENTRLGATAFRILRLGIFALLILAAGRYASAQFLAFTLHDVVFIAATALVFMLVFWRWEAGIVLILATTTFIFYSDYLPTLSLYHFIPEIRILEPLRLQLGQGLMLYLLALFVASNEVRTLRQRAATPLTPAVLIFLVTALFASVSGVVFKSVPLNFMVEWSRPYSFYLMYFVALLCIRGRRELRILLGAFYVMALVMAFLMFVQFAVGDRFKLFLGGNIRVESFGSRAGRILPPGSDLVWMAIPFVVARIPTMSAKGRKWMVVSLSLLLGGLLLTFTRTVWMGTVVSMGIMAVLGRGEIRRGLLHTFLAMAAFAGLLLLVLSLVSTEKENYVTPYIKRFTSTFEPESYGETTSAGARWIEIRSAWPKVVENPWLGVGVGGSYMQVEAWDDRGQAHYLRHVRYMHNAYMLVLTTMGALGLGTLLLMYVVFFARARKIYRSLIDPVDRSIVLASIGAIASIMVGAIMQPTFGGSLDVPMIGTIFGIIELVRYLSANEAKQRAAAQAVRLVPGRPAALRAAR
jgi:O-antigen ligase